MNSDGIGENRFHHEKSGGIALARENLYNEINTFHHRSIHNASICRQYAMSTVGRERTFLSCAYQIDKIKSIDLIL